MSDTSKRAEELGAFRNNLIEQGFDSSEAFALTKLMVERDEV